MFGNMNTYGYKITNIMLTFFKLRNRFHESIQCAGHLLAGTFGAFFRRDLKLFYKFRYGDMFPGHTQ